jgi:predicted kinase
LESGRGVIIDASFRTRNSRQAAKALAQKHNLPFCFVECHAPREESLRRLDARAEGSSISDGRAELYDEFVARFEPTLEMGKAEHLRLDTTLSLEAQLTVLRERLAQLS